MKTPCIIFRAKNYTYPDDYAKSASSCRWQSSSRISGWFLLYRLLLAALFVSILIRNDDWYKFFIFLTDWGFVGLTIHYIISAAAIIEQLFIQKDHGNGRSRETWLMKISWVFYNMANVVPFIISVVYWTALYDPAYGIIAYDFLLHGVNIIAVVLDIFVGARPLFFLHIYQPIVALLTYVIFSVIYWAAGGLGTDGNDWIYPILKWDYPGDAMIVVGVLFVFTFVVQGVVVLLHLLRDFIFRKCVPQRPLDESSGVDNVGYEIRDRVSA